MRQYLVVEGRGEHKKEAEPRNLGETGQKRAVFNKKRAKTREKCVFKRLTKFSGFNIMVEHVVKTVV